MVNTGGTTINAGLGVKPGTKPLGLNDKSKAALRNRLSEVMFLIIDELSLFSSDLWTDSCFQFFSKTEDRFSQAMKQAAKEAFENNMHHHDTMKTTVNGYLTNREFFSGGSLPYFARIEAKENLSSWYFVNTNLPEENYKI